MKNRMPEENPLRRTPLYQQAAQILRSKLSNMTPGECLPPERVLAQQYDISLTTVREAVRILAAEGLVVRRQGKGTFLAEAAPGPKGRVGHVALLIHHNISNPRTSSIYLRLAQEIREALDAEGISNRLYISRRTPGQEQFDFHCPEFFQDLEEGRVCGVIGVLLAGKSSWIAKLEQWGIKMVGFGFNKPYGANDDTGAFFRSALRELAHRGRRRVAYLGWGGFESDRHPQAELFREVLAQEGLPVVNAWIKDDIYPTLEGSGWSAFREIWSATAERPDAVVIADDFFLRGVVSAVSEIGIAVPEQLEIAVMFSDGSSLEHPFPVIAWRPDVPLIARTIAQVQMTLLQGEEPIPAMRLLPGLRAPELDYVRLVAPALPPG